MIKELDIWPILQLFNYCVLLHAMFCEQRISPSNVLITLIVLYKLYITSLVCSTVMYVYPCRYMKGCPWKQAQLWYKAKQGNGDKQVVHDLFYQQTFTKLPCRKNMKFVCERCFFLRLITHLRNQFAGTPQIYLPFAHNFLKVPHQVLLWPNVRKWHC